MIVVEHLQSVPGQVIIPGSTERYPASPHEPHTGAHSRGWPNTVKMLPPARPVTWSRTLLPLATRCGPVWPTLVRSHDDETDKTAANA